MEYTGDYNICTRCSHIYDYDDACPECGSFEIEDLNAKEVKQWSKSCINKESERLNKMLESHGDYSN